MKIIGLALAVSLFCGLNTRAQITPSSAPGFGAKALAFSEKSTTGQPIHFPEDYQGKLVMLDFWATWCGPCRRELPNLVKVYEEFHSKGFEVIGISLDSAATLPGLANFTAENHMPWPQIADGQFWQAALAQKYGVRSIPDAWLIDVSTGQVVAMRNELRGETLRTAVARRLQNLGNPVPVAESPPALESPGTTLTPALRQTDPALAKAEMMANEGRLMNADAFAAQVSSPERAKIDLLPAATQPLKGREIAGRARLAHVRVGWFFHCTRCNNWHLNAAGGYAIAKDTVVTAFHVLEPPVNMKKGEGHPVVIRGDSEIIPITVVLAADKEMDAIVVHVAVSDLAPLPLASSVQVGDTAYCFSDPQNARGYFSSGIVNRLYSLSTSANPDPRLDRINLSTDWSPGSSGSAVLDECGNAIGHVARIQSISKSAPVPATSVGSATHPPETNSTYMNLHEAVPAKAVLTLIGRP